MLNSKLSSNCPRYFQIGPNLFRTDISAKQAKNALSIISVPVPPRVPEMLYIYNIIFFFNKYINIYTMSKTRDKDTISLVFGLFWLFFGPQKSGPVRPAS